MELEVGELYTSSRLGLFVIKELYDRSEIIYDTHLNNQIGTLERLNFGDRVYKLYNDDRIRKANDSDIMDFILSKLTTHDLNGHDFLVIDESGVTVFGDQEAVYLNKKSAMKLKELLNRELNE
jgi:hypothetical protein